MKTRDYLKVYINKIIGTILGIFHCKTLDNYMLKQVADRDIVIKNRPKEEKKESND